MDRAEIEKQIRDLLATEVGYWKLSDQLFGPDGLFGKLGATIEERKVIGRSPLFKQAQKRIRDMEYEMADRLRREMKKRPVRLERSKQE
jgi:fructose 1,6-bisphosphatase